MAIYVNIHSKHNSWEKKTYYRVIIDTYIQIECSPFFLGKSYFN